MLIIRPGHLLPHTAWICLISTLLQEPGGAERSTPRTLEEGSGTQSPGRSPTSVLTGTTLAWPLLGTQAQGLVWREGRRTAHAWLCQAGRVPWKHGDAEPVRTHNHSGLIPSWGSPRTPVSAQNCWLLLNPQRLTGTWRLQHGQQVGAGPACGSGAEPLGQSLHHPHSRHLEGSKEPLPKPRIK